MIRAIIFDFNDVIADDKAPHLLCFQQALEEHVLSLTKGEYYGAYLGMDERTCVTALLSAREVHCDQGLLQTIIDRKAELFREYTASHRPPLFPGVVEFVKQAGTTYRLAIASGGRREQIDAALGGTPLEQDFEVIVTAEDCSVGKPDQAIYRLVCERLNSAGGVRESLSPDQALVIEDSRAGILSAKAAGMAVLGLSITYSPEQLTESDLVLPNFIGMTPTQRLHNSDF